MSVKYKTYTDLAAAFACGELNRDHWVLILDNDCCHLQYRGPVPQGVDRDQYEDEMYEHSRTLFEGNGYNDLGELADAAGIPNEWC